jgi:plasmid stabilization system protein ParE
MKGAAAKLLDQLENQLRQLADHPETYTLVADGRLRQDGIRLFPVGNYLCFYRIRRQEKTVTVRTCLCARRDWVHLLDEDAR